MLLAQAQELGTEAIKYAKETGMQDNTTVETATKTASLSLFLLLPLMSLLMFVFWIVALAQVISRNDLKLNKWLYILALFVVSPIGMLFYFFGENRKKLGWAVVIIMILAVITIIAAIF